ncbi:hypothetical protein JHK87_027818 [Glycine soja]|nr:hypothetical protein JHK87_027818 [Glycine soja]
MRGNIQKVEELRGHEGCERRGTSKIDPGSVLDNRGENNDDNADKHVEGSDSDTNGSMVVAKDNVEALEEKDDDTDVEYHGFDDLDYATNALCIIVNEGNLGIANWVVAFSFERREKGSGTSVRVCKALSLSIRDGNDKHAMEGITTTNAIFYDTVSKAVLYGTVLESIAVTIFCSSFSFSLDLSPSSSPLYPPSRTYSLCSGVQYRKSLPQGRSKFSSVKVSLTSSLTEVVWSESKDAAYDDILNAWWLVDHSIMKLRCGRQVKGHSAVHEASGLQDSGHILEEGKSIYNTTLVLTGQGYFDLNIPYPEPSPANKAIEQGNRTGLAVKAMELGYIGIAYNRMIKGIMSDHHRCSISPLILSSFLNVLPSLSLSANLHHHLLHVPLSTPFRQYTRLTVCVDSASQAQALNLGNPILKTYDLVIVKPLNQIAFDLACERMEDDIVSIDFSVKLPFRLKQPMAVYHMPTTENDMPSRSIPLALQILFYKLQYSDTSVATKEFTKSFGWDTYDSFMQHDVQELNRVLYEKLEDKMKGTVVEGTIHKLFEGNHMNYIECINVDYKTTRKKSFYDLQLDVNGCPDVYASFDNFDFPHILQIQLKRFEYDFMWDTMVKVSSPID